jgi:Holliday junction resolvase RusA-like endonuclease
MSAVVRIAVPGDPVPLERARVGNGRHYLPARSVEYRERVQTAWMRSGRPDLGDVPLTASMRFYIARPASHYGTGRNAHTMKAAAIAILPPGDIDNYCKATLDALSTLAYTDDRQVVCLSGVHKCWADSDGPRSIVEFWSANR